MYIVVYYSFFFFSSRRRHTRCGRDWSSDVCSSDLEDFTKADQRYDLIYDLVGNHTFSERRRILNQNGICVMAGVGGAGWHDGIAMRLAGELNAYVRSRFVSQKFIAYIAQFNKQDMTLLADLMQSGKITPVIDRTYKLNQTADALPHCEQGHARGKVVINLE